MSPYIWGLYPDNTIEIKTNIDSWNEFIVKNYPSDKKVKFKELLKAFNNNNQGQNQDVISELEKEYGKNLENIPLEIINEKREYLLNLFNLEKQRQNLLDNKSIQIITQTSIITAIIALIIPLLIDDIDFNNDFKRISFWIFVILLLLTLKFLLYSVILSIVNLRTTGYLRPMHTLILHHSKSTQKELSLSQLVTYYESIEKNIKVNNNKAEQINKSYNKFKIGLVLFVISAFAFVGHRFIYKFDGTKSIKIENQLNFEPIENDLKTLTQEQNESNVILNTISNELIKTNNNLDSMTTNINNISKDLNKIQTKK